MNEVLKSMCDFIREMSRYSTLKSSRGYADVLADRIVQAGTQPSLLAFSERLCGLMGTEISRIPERTTAAFLRACGDGNAVLQWLRRYPKVAAMLCVLKEDEYRAAMETIEIDTIDEKGMAIAAGSYDIPITITCVSPLSHGADIKAGNATLFRRIHVLTDMGGIVSLPIYGGNAIRGMLRDLLADHYLKSLGLTPRRDKPPVTLWFFHALYCGGCLEEDSAAAKALGAALGSSGAVKCAGITHLRDMIPPISLLGSALGNRVIAGRIQTCDLRPRCRQWGTGLQDVSEIFDWVYLTRREDYEAWSKEGDDAHTGMIANTECLKPGVVLDGGINLSDHLTSIERACLARALSLLQKTSLLGAQNARGLGQVEIKIDNCPDPLLYDAYLEDHRAEIMEYLISIRAMERQGELL